MESMKDIIKFREVESKDFKKIHKWLNEKHVIDPWKNLLVFEQSPNQ